MPPPSLPIIIYPDTKSTEEVSKTVSMIESPQTAKTIAFVQDNQEANTSGSGRHKVPLPPGM